MMNITLSSVIFIFLPMNSIDEDSKWGFVQGLLNSK